ncbi:hypothetical protein ACSBR2_004661 [Camellia fascicularis]
MATITDTANVGGDQNPGSIGLPTLVVTFVVNLVVVTSPVNLVAISAVSGGPLNHHERLEKFTRVNFNRWQQKILFNLTTFNLVRFLSEDPLVVEENEQNKQKLMALDVWK